MEGLVIRNAEESIEKYLKIFPAVAVLGPRQCGKSTLIKTMANVHREMLYVDLQDRRELAKLHDPMLFFANNRERIICLDEVQLVPELFSYLRSEIDADRRQGRFVLLGSASRDLLQHTSESLAGRIGLLDLTPFLLSEVCGREDFRLLDYWFRGGYPDSFLANGDEASSLWRENFLRTYLERDIPQLGFQIASPTMMRLLTMLAHDHGGMFNASKIANAMDLSAPTIRHYVDIMEQTYIVRFLQPHYRNIKKRLTKTPRLYIRDSGLLHQILGLYTFNDVLGHPVLGESWEGLVIENICSTAKGATFSFYRSASGDEEMDLLLEYPNRLIAIECKSSTAPQVTQGFWKAIHTLQPDHTYVVAPVDTRYALDDDVEVINLPDLLTIIQH